MTEPLPTLPEIEHWLKETYTSQMREYAESARAPLLKRIAELEHQLSGAQKDAERYRWLRYQEIPDILDCYHQNPDRMDERIDAAMQHTSDGGAA